MLNLKGHFVKKIRKLLSDQNKLASLELKRNVLMGDRSDVDELTLADGRRVLKIQLKIDQAVCITSLFYYNQDIIFKNHF